MKRILLALVAVVGLVVLAAAGYVAVFAFNASRGVFPPEGESIVAQRSGESARESEQRQQKARAAVGRRGGDQILFGDLHVHTVYSADAHLQAIKIRERESLSPPADACDFARFCSQLDFWSINDHAESLTPDLWRRTVRAIRDCDRAAGDPVAPDMVSFLGWEWSHAARTATEHYGHKNVVLRDLEDGSIPTRPIASSPGPPVAFLTMGALAPLLGTVDLEGLASFHRYTLDMIAVDDCPPGVSVRDLPVDCREAAATPKELFDKLAEWDVAALVIPHGLAWGTTNPAHADLSMQLEMHDPRWQRLLEVYSGHGNSEVYRDFGWPALGKDGRWSCPPTTADFEPCCQRAVKLARKRCEHPDSEECAVRIIEAQQIASDTWGGMRSPVSAVKGTTLEDWGDCNQLQGAFLPAFNYRPGQSAQRSFALGTSATGVTDSRYRWGLIGASDIHRSRPGTGYREFARQRMSDGAGYPFPDGFVDGRNSSYYYTGGLAAVHTSSRDRHAIFEALQKRHVYATSGDRILLWFDLLRPDGSRVPMGSEVLVDEAPRFEVRAVGAWEQKPGCPEMVHAAMTPQRIADLCLGSCYHPSDVRKPITAIEVVRIRPQRTAEESTDSLIDDPWRRFVCPADGSGCVVEFEDPDVGPARPEGSYYVRAIQAPSPAVNGAQARCERDSDGECKRGRPCGDGADGQPDDCLAPVGERAWSSPIFVDFR